MSRKIFQIILLLFLKFFPRNEATQTSPFIVGGSLSKMGEFPFIVSLQFLQFDNETWVHYCGGTILNKLWILTSASCVYGDEEISQNRVQYGINEIFNLTDAINIVTMKELYWHDEYDSITKFNDIGLIKVSSAIEIDHFDYKIKLPTSSDYFATGTSAWIAGK